MQWKISNSKFVRDDFLPYLCTYLLCTPSRMRTITQLTPMKVRDFFKKLFAPFVVINLTAMALVVVAMVVGLQFALDAYTRHGESIAIPDFNGMNIDKDRKMMEEQGITIMETDSGRNKHMPANAILLQTPEAGAHIKSGRTIYVTVNSLSSPLVAIPDIIDNSSAREAEARLRSMGFVMLSPQYVEGEQDWVYGVTCRGRRLTTGERVSTDLPLSLVVGSGTYGNEGEIDTVDINYSNAEGDIDEFEEVNGPSE